MAWRQKMTFDKFDVMRLAAVFVIVMSAWNDKKMMFYFIGIGVGILILSFILEYFLSKKEVSKEDDITGSNIDKATNF